MPHPRRRWLWVWLAVALAVVVIGVAALRLMPRGGSLGGVSAAGTGHAGGTVRQHTHDNHVEWAGLRHDSRDPLYRSPGSAVPARTAVRLRFRTFHDDVTNVQVRVYSVNAQAEQFIPMTIALAGVPCEQADLSADLCDYWEATITSAEPDNLWYRFLVRDGADQAFYADDTVALDGGLGATTAEVVDNSYALMFFDPAFTTPDWLRHAIIYQIFPDRFRQGAGVSDAITPRTGDHRYADPVLSLPWGTLPEGYCRDYADAQTDCPWRFDAHPPAWIPTVEDPRGRDYMGGNLQGIIQKLDYLQRLGVTVIYLNPIYAAASNHRYDTRDYHQIDPYLGTLADFTQLVTEARQCGMHIILDGVFNHTSSDSPFFDRYHAFGSTGACEDAASPQRNWYIFQAPQGNASGSCVPSTPGGSDTSYVGWDGFDTLPVLNKSDPAVQSYFITGDQSVARTWLQRGADGWRLDVMGDPSFPAGYWEQFRQVVKALDPQAAIIGELWQKDSTILRDLRGDRADTAMNYRLRDAVLGLLAPQPFDAKNLGDSGHSLTPSQFTARLLAIQEDYPAPAYNALMNLLDSHDTARVLWDLTPGAPTLAAKEQDAANVAEGKQRQQLAALIQFTLPGAPTIYYGDEVGMTGADDPDNRRTFPWDDTSNGGRTMDLHLLAYYQSLGNLRHATPALLDGDLHLLLADDAAGTVAYSRQAASQTAIIIINRAPSPQTVTIPLGAAIPDGTVFHVALSAPATILATYTAAHGMLTLPLPPLSGAVLIGGA